MCRELWSIMVFGPFLMKAKFESFGELDDNRVQWSGIFANSTVCTASTMDQTTSNVFRGGARVDISLNDQGLCFEPIWPGYPWYLKTFHPRYPWFLNCNRRHANTTYSIIHHPDAFRPTLVHPRLFMPINSHHPLTRILT